MYYNVKYCNLSDKTCKALVEAVSIENVLQICRDFAKEVYAVSLSNIRETYPDSSQDMKWVKVDCQDTFVDPETGKGKTTKYSILLQLDNADDAARLAREIVTDGYDLEFVGVSIYKTQVLLQDEYSGTDNDSGE